MTAPPARKQFTVEDYARMRETGILTEDDRVELLDGEIYLMSPIGPVHVALVNKLNRILGQQIGDQGIISIQNPIRLDPRDEPQPDIAILAPRDDFYASALATPDDILLVIEVADTTLTYDREQKLPRYAQAHIGEVWIIDPSAQTIEQYTNPVQGLYTNRHTVLPGENVRAQNIPSISFTSDRIF
ncbi:MAG: Uma2 family endonuclease [Chloroflexi bacterium]|nr:Uma2 family endonuclease [Chloroflexota bacterium]